MNPARRRAIFRRLQEANPSPTTELLYQSPFELLTAVMLSAHTTDKSVNAATRNLFPVANTPEAIVKLGVEGVKPYIKPAGLYNTKAQNLVTLAQQIVDKHKGEVPSTREDLEALPGVGRKTASIILNMVFGHPEVAVDTHIFRVANRTGLAPGKNPREVEDELVATTPKEYLKDAHHWLILHGRYVCVARVPACPKCIIADLCEYPNKTPPKDVGKSDAPVVRRVGPRPKNVETRGEGSATRAKGVESHVKGAGARTRGAGKFSAARAKDTKSNGGSSVARTKATAGTRSAAEAQSRPKTATKAVARKHKRRAVVGKLI